MQNPYLIVAPIALLENWQAEYPKFFDEGEIGFHHALRSGTTELQE